MAVNWYCPMGYELAGSEGITGYLNHAETCSICKQETPHHETRNREQGPIGAQLQQEPAQKPRL